MTEACLVNFGTIVLSKPYDTMLKHAGFTFDEWPTNLSNYVKSNGYELDQVMSLSRSASIKYGFYPEHI